MLRISACLEPASATLRRPVIAACLVFAMVARLLAAESDEFLPAEELELDHALTTGFATPHVAWARPWAGGRTRVLFFTRGSGTDPRECVELVQRFDLDAKAGFLERIVDTDIEHWHGGRSGLERIRKMLAEPWDAYVFAGGVALDRLASEDQHRILTRVVDGSAGLVLVGVDDARICRPERRIEADWALSGGGGAAFSAGPGRVVRMPARPQIPFAEGWQARDESWHEALGRALMWAARKEPSARLAIAVGAEARFDQAHDMVLTLAGVVPTDARVTASVRRTVGGPLALDPLPVQPGAELRLRIPPLPAGAYHLDAQVVSAAGVHTWATTAFTVASPRSVSVELGAAWGEIGDRVAGRIALAGPALPGERVRVRLFDPDHRELVRQEVGDDRAFSIPVEGWMPMLLAVEAQVEDAGGAVAARASVSFNVCKRGRDRFNFLIWDCPVGTLAPYAEASLARHGVSLQIGRNPTPMVAANGISWVAYTTRITAALNPDTGMRLGPVDWDDDAAVAQHASQLVREFSIARRHGVFAYSLGDENQTRGCTTTGPGLERYRGFLRGRYASLDELNATWGSAFRDWSEVGLGKPEDNEEEGSLRSGRYPRWYDRQVFKSWNYLRLCRVFRTAFAGLDPQAKTGFEGAGEFAAGDDIDGIVGAMDFWAPYPGMTDHIVASIAPRVMPRANWMGYTKDADSLLGKYWRMVFLGMDAAWWWRWDAIGRFHGWLAPDLRPYPAVTDILDDTRLVREGLGDLLLRCERAHDRIALYYSYPSIFAARIGGADYERDHRKALSAIRGMGLSAAYVTDAQVRRDPAVLNNYSTLVLPLASALDESEAAAIRAFAAAGGTVLTDARPGIFDQRLRLRGDGMLDREFGCSGPVAVPGRQPADADRGGPASGSFRRIGSRFDTDAGAQALRQALGGRRPAIAVTGADGTPANLWVQRWRTGRFEIVGVMIGTPDPDNADGDHPEGLARAEDALPVRISLDEAREGYDLRAGRSLGKISVLEARLRTNRPAWFAFAGAVPPQVRLAVPATADRGSRLQVRLTVPDAGDGMRAFRLAAAVDGRELGWAAQTVLAGRDGATCILPIAGNDPLGTWRITLRDVLTGDAVSADVTVRDP